MTICIATDSYPPHNSGIATHNAYLVRLLKESGNKIVVLTADFENNREEDTVEDQGDLVIVTLKKTYREQHAYFSRFIRQGTKEAVTWLSLGMAMRNWLLKHHGSYGFDVIEFSDYGGFGIFLVDKMLPPTVVMTHGMLTQLNKKEFHNQDENLSVIRFLETNSIKHADAVICHSKSNAKDIAGEFEVDTRYVTAPWINKRIQANKPITHEFIIASRLQVCKGALVMAEVMDSLLTDHPQIKITWIGEDTYTAPAGWMVSKYIKKHFASVWQKTFVWKKAIPRKQLMEELEASQTVIIPSTWETFNYVALEAANRKKSLVLTKQAGIASVIEPAGNLLLTDADDNHSIREAMIQLHLDKSLSSKLGNNLSAVPDLVFNKTAFLHDRKQAYSAAIERRKLSPPSNPLASFFIPLQS